MGAPNHASTLRLRSLLAVAAALAVLGSAPAPTSRIALVHGRVEIGTGEPPAWRAAHEGDAVAAGDLVRTGSDGRAEVQLAGANVRLYENSLLRLPAAAVGAGSAEGVALEEGSSLFDVVRRKAGGRFEVRTPQVVVSVKGTRFGVDLAQAAPAVSVYEGTVGLRDAVRVAEREVLVHEGFAAVGAGLGSFDLRVVQHADPWQGWSQGAPAAALRERLDAPPAARAAVAEARSAARRASDPEVLTRAAQRRPELAEKLRARADGAAVHRETRAQREARGLEPGALDPTPREQLRELDPLRDRGARELDRSLRKEIVETALNEGSLAGATDPSTGIATLPFSVERLDDRELRISGAAFSVKVKEHELHKVIEEGRVQELPGPLREALAARGVDPVQFSQQLHGLLH